MPEETLIPADGEGGFRKMARCILEIGEMLPGLLLFEWIE